MKYSCDNCSFTTRSLGDVQPLVGRIHERVSANEVMPFGECPECGAHVHAMNAPHNKLEKIENLWTQAAETNAKLRKEVSKLREKVAELMHEQESTISVTDDEFTARGVEFVTLYSVTRHYGGPEEGGWYYDWSTVGQVIAIPAGDPEGVAAALREQYPNENRFSVRAGTDYEVVIETAENIGGQQTKERPRYE